MRDHMMLDCNHAVACEMTLKYWRGSLIIDSWRFKESLFIKRDICNRPSVRLIRIFTHRNCFYLDLNMSVIKFFESFYLLLLLLDS